VLGCWTLSRKGTERPSRVPDPTERRRGAEKRFEVPQFLFYVVQKKHRDGPPKPVIQSHYIDY
jgi:hypothetical protein